MDAARKWRFRFGLNGLLIGTALLAVAVAIYRLIPNQMTAAERARIVSGMDEKAVLAIADQPARIEERDGFVNWWYDYELLAQVAVRFKNGHVVETRWRGL
jgi:hypothetical protein